MEGGVADNQTIDVTVRLDKDLKENGEVFFRGLGMSFSTAVNAFVSYSLKHGKLPFDGATEQIETEEEYYAEIRSRLENAKAGNIVVHDLVEDDQCTWLGTRKPGANMLLGRLRTRKR
jgi:DNA-damage-inducible protein J